MQKDRGGCLKYFLIIILVLALLGGIAKACDTIRYSGSYSSSSSSSYVSTPRPASTRTPTQPSTTKFGDDAEAMAAEIKQTLGDGYKYSWFANGYKFSFTVKLESISGDDLADMYASDPGGAQSVVDDLNESMRQANKSTWEKFKKLGYTDCTIIFSVCASDGLEICTVENGRITHSITKDNFRYG